MTHSSVLPAAIVLLSVISSFAAQPAKKPPRPKPSITNRYPLPYPPKLPDGQTVVTERTDAFLKPGSTLRFVIGNDPVAWGQP